MTTATLDPTTGTIRRAVVHIDDLDIVGLMHNARYALILERAMAEFWAEHGYSFQNGVPSSPDMIAAVREFTITYHAPVRGTGPILVQFWLDGMGETSAVYGFRFLSEDGTTVFADGRRVMVKMDRSGRPTPWTEQGREIAGSLSR
ncbi:thioesterase [Catellatospora methionotrophica]|uniref:Thioesterase n=1 Tax=Catellatospora methionotrophica TaxID=121620 RepID=A0A8J3L8G9_9ACTN|nr:thioesterase family protein [Catellatospora methionotrophica]GIG14227.1 thioesterase [Catellatospora methionotrophica]